jgi:ribonuclease P protein component
MEARPNSGRGTKRRRLSRSAEFERVYRQGRSRGNRFLVVYTFPRDGDDDADGPRLGLSVSRRVGGSVERSRVKRVLREAFKQEQAYVADGADYVLVARPALRELDERDGLEGVRTALRELLQPASERGGGARRQAAPAA